MERKINDLIVPLIQLQITIDAPIDVVFDLSRSIDFHQITTAQTNEKAIAGKTSGFIEFNETVTWKARHFGIYQTLTSKITAFDRPYFFVDEQVKGAFKSFRHEHRFEVVDGKTQMTDLFEYHSPMGIIGQLADLLFLKTYMLNFLVKRQKMTKAYAESGDVNI
tara:strand:+ start:2915 stop:3406 length:492 start_codon:yes stop_codon:yes gene_type:complete